MRYDNGEELVGLDENWTFAGANAMEWLSGGVVFVIFAAFVKSVSTAVPFMLIGCVTTTMTLASLRKIYPDEERGVRNAVMTSCGFVPLGIPAPAKIQSYWSGAPLRRLSSHKKFVSYGLDRLFVETEAEVEEERS